MTTKIYLSTLCIALAAASGCKPAEKKAEAHPPPATVDKVQQESDLNKIVLKPEA
ncbi:MAG TPA: hypothetical protein VKH44_00805 [Pirellulaceae bacterium]|nr:hypothetical protein [Pirellulaceae bacterium]